ncbi:MULTISPECIES: NUDIX domain-containing protein [Bacillaceae]|uniref:NUDIX hydrolase n=1 Tax=Bacillaceae TaxID=186817 RepID=UPI0006F4D70A|nr:MULTISPECIES: NUDIX domain-containing protein [Bacillaceae]KQL35098.1 DNA mismatch repair protein MutT [Psychrobacillus sp. FJAT-21963]MDF2067256.1 NUDIX domain-containing protein [Bacillus sp. Cr_A10]
MRNRGATVIIENDRVALIKRTKPHITYYVFPGGGIESGETPEEAAIRETFEELGVHVQIKRPLKVLEQNGRQYYYLADIIGGTFGAGTGEEYTQTSVQRGTYEPIWVNIEDLPTLDVRPKEIVEIL